MCKKCMFLALLFSFFVSITAAADAASIEFDVDDLFSSKDFATILRPENRLSPIDQEKYKPLNAKNLVQVLPLILSGGGGELKLMLVCDDVNESAAMKNVQLISVDDSKDKPKVVQRFKLNEGEEPHMFPASGTREPGNVMVRILRKGNNAECYVYDINAASGKLTETFRINRGTPERLKVDVKAVMQADGQIEISSRLFSYDDTLDLSSALGALVEDEIYQENGRPIPAIVNLKCVRAGWEDDRLYTVDGTVLLDLGLSLVTLSKKTVAEVFLTYKKESGGKWVPQSMTCVPFLPYR